MSVRICLCFFTTTAFCQSTITFDLPQLVKDQKIEVHNREMEFFKEGNRDILKLSKNYGEGIAWIKEFQFSEGTIEFDVRGENIKQGSFVGFAFGIQDTSIFEAIYLRPFKFEATDSALRKRSTQYIFLPNYTWRKLREIAPKVYEDEIVPSPDPNAWNTVKIIIHKKSINTFINGSNSACLHINSLSPYISGKIGFYVADISGGEFSNLRITPLPQ